MESFRKKLLFPPAWLMAMLSVLSVAGLIAVFAGGWDAFPVSYGIYVLAFYTLCTVTVFCIAVLPGRYRQIRQKILANSLANRYFTDRAFRERISLYLALSVNILYVAVNLGSWYMLRSRWFVVLAVYYGIMVMMRFLLAGYVHNNALGANREKEWKRSRSCAYILLLINLSLSGAVLMILYRNRGYEYPGVTIYAMALYTFYAVIHAATETVKYRSQGNPVMTTAKTVSLSAALVSLLNLETAMFSRFGADMAPEKQRLMIILTGAGVSVSVITLSILQIVKATKEIGREGNGK